MSGIFGILNLRDEPVAPGDLSAMAALLSSRDPNGQMCWADGRIGLGHTLLPLIHAASGCVITADARLDNRDELLDRLNLADQAGVIGDAGVLLEAYLAWGDTGLSRCFGDFALAIWDPRRQALMCARDPFGMRPLYYHHAPGRCFIFASEPKAILALSQVPYRLNEGRIADYLVPALQWIDYASTFFDEVFRLPPAEVMTVTPAGVTRRKYWTLEPGPELRLASDEAYADAMREVLSTAVRSRLRASGAVGVTLSGGLDSGAVAALAAELHGDAGPLLTFSGVGPDPEVCGETAAIRASVTMPGLAPHTVDYTNLGELIPDLERNPDEPFDGSMVLLRAVYLSARRQGIRVMLDGAGGDIVLNEGSHLLRLWRQGHWVDALRQAPTVPIGQTLRTARAALTPNAARRAVRSLLDSRRAESEVRRSIIDPDFARRIDLVGRLRVLAGTQGNEWIDDYRRELAAAIQPNVIAGRERYGRVASASGVEARDPYLDRRVVEFCLSLPASQRMAGGFTKVILRRAMAGRLPDVVRWRQDKQHLGWSFRTALLTAQHARLRDQHAQMLDVLQPYVSKDAVRAAFIGYFERGDSSQVERVLVATTLAQWLIGSASRPVATATRSC